MTTRNTFWIPFVVIAAVSLRPVLFPVDDRTESLDVPLAVVTQSNRAVFDIECGQPGTPDEWLIIVGSLGHPLDDFAVHLSAETISECELKPFQVIGTALSGRGWKDTKPRLMQFRGFPAVQPRPPDNGAVLLSAEALTTGNWPTDGSERRSFSIHVTDGLLEDPRHYVTVGARLAAVSKRVRVYLDEQVHRDEVAVGLLEQLVSEFDNGVVARMENEFGAVSDVDRDGRFAVLLSPWLSKLQGGAVSLKGFVRSSDFQPNRRAPFSNQSDVMYLNSNLRPGPELTGLLAHEFTHAIICDRRSRSASGDEEDWLNEGLAHLSETRYSHSLSNIDHRVARFHNDPSRCPLAVRDYYSAGLWRDHGCRGAAWSFANWLQYRFGNEVFSGLIDSDSTGVKNVERATGVEFSKLFREWTVSVFEPTVRDYFHRAASRRTPWHLSAPAAVDWSSMSDVSLKTRGTAFTAIRVSTPGRYRIRMSADCGAELQVSLLPIRRTHDVKVSAVMGVDSEIIVTVSGDVVRRVRQLSLEDHSTARSSSTCVTTPVAESVDQANGTAFTLPRPGGIFNSPTRLNRLAVKAVVETTDGRDVRVRGRVSAAGPLLAGDGQSTLPVAMLNSASTRR